MRPAGSIGVRGLAAVAAIAGAACGYRVTTAYHLRGAERASVRPFDNLSGDPELGAAVTAALREELARRGAAGEGAAIEGDVHAGDAAPSSPDAATYRVAVDVRARLRVGADVVAEKAVRRELDYVAGGDALETEARRALALRRLAAEAARDVLRAFER